MDKYKKQPPHETVQQAGQQKWKFTERIEKDEHRQHNKWVEENNDPRE